MQFLGALVAMFAILVKNQYRQAEGELWGCFQTLFREDSQKNIRQRITENVGKPRKTSENTDNSQESNRQFTEQ